MSRKLCLGLGAVLELVALVGFLTVADDLRHTGEAAAVSGLGVAGLGLLLAGLRPALARHLALPWLAVGLGAGMLGGLPFDRVALGTLLGGAAGLILARVRRAR